ncbi:MAG: hypothetical protein M1269_12975 [Chloroflexi bacterium]|nr:hypothetical protein [Chloroflexota bacterium]
MKLEKVGIFPYSPEEGTQSAEARPRIRKNTMMKRYRKAMLLQQEISRENNRRLQGRVLPVMVDAVFKAGSLLGVIDDPEVRKWLPEVVGTGRTGMDAPEIDGQVYITGKVPSKGDIIEAEIIDSSAYDLLAKIRECSN